MTRRNLNIKLLFLIGFVLIIIIVLFIFSFFSTSNTSENGNESVTPTVFLSPEEIEKYKSFIPVGEEGMTEENAQEYLQQREEAKKAFADRKERLPFLMQLPYTGNTFKIEITPYSDTVYITTNPPDSNKQLYRQQAIDWLEENGANFDNFEIEYKN